MEWHLDKKRPICPQIEELISARIAAGELKTGERLPSVRDVAIEAGVNPNTVQKAFKMLEERGLIYSERSTGWFVSDNRAAAKKTVRSLALQKTAAFLEEMEQLALSEEEILAMIRARYETKKNETEKKEEKKGREDA